MLMDIYSTFRVKYENRYTGISYFENDFKKNLINNEIHLAYLVNLITRQLYFNNTSNINNIFTAKRNKEY
jgi:hypothetical protein